jgi:hypothetical protein
MFRFFKKDTEKTFTFDERMALVDSYLRKAEELAYSYEYHHQPYKRGGVEQLDEFIYKLQTIQHRIKQLETVEMAEEREKLLNLLDK